MEQVVGNTWDMDDFEPLKKREWHSARKPVVKSSRLRRVELDSVAFFPVTE